MRFQVGFDTWYLLAHPDDIYDVTVTRHQDFVKPKINKRIFRFFLGNGLLSSDGAYWKRQHKLIMPGFHKRRIDAYGELMVRYTEEMLAGYADGQQRDMSDDMHHLTLRIVVKALFDADVKEDAPTVGRAMKVINQVLVDHVNMPLPTPRWWPSKANRRKHQAIREIEEIVQGVIEDRRASGQDQGDLLSMLLMAKSESGEQMTDQELRDESMTLFFAGHDTTAFTLVWTWYLLAKNPRVKDKLDEELNRVLGGRSPVVDDLPTLPYLGMVVRESMRILPSVWSFMRSPVRDVEIGGYTLEKGSNIFIVTWIPHRDPRWYDDPEVFVPERWEGKLEKEIPRGAYLPFSHGPRVCIGKAFALMEARLVLATMAQRIDATLADDHQLTYWPRLSLSPKGGLPLTVRNR